MDGLADILNFLSIDRLLATSGQPDPAQFGLLARAGFTAVINLATEASENHLPQEPALCREAGLDFAWRPVIWNAPAAEDFEALAAWLDANRRRKVLVHCALNYRASLMTFLYRVGRENADPTAAFEDVLAVWEPEPVWAVFANRVLDGFPGVTFRLEP